MGWIWGVGGMVTAGTTGALVLLALLVGLEDNNKRRGHTVLAGWLMAVGWVGFVGLLWGQGEVRTLQEQHLWFGAASVGLEIILCAALAPLVNKAGLLMTVFPRTGIAINRLLRHRPEQQKKLRKQVVQQNKGLQRKVVRRWLFESPDPAIWQAVLPHTKPRNFPELLDKLASRSVTAAARATTQVPTGLVETLDSKQRARLLEVSHPRLRQQLVRRMGHVEGEKSP